MASKKWKTASLPFFKSRVKDMPDPLGAQSSGRSVGTDYKMRLMQRKQTGFSGEVPKHRYSDELEPQKTSQPSDKKGYGHSRSDSSGSLATGGQTGDLLFLEIRCKQLKDERDIFEQLFLAEQLKNRRMVRRFTNQEVGGIQLEEAQDHALVQKLEAQLQGFTERCEALDSALKAKNVEAEDLRKHVHELEATASASDDLVEQHVKKINHLREELAKSETDRLLGERCLDEKNLELLLATQKVLQLEGVIAKNKTEYQEQIMVLREELAKTEFECFDSNRSLEDKTAEARKLTELVNFLENQVSKAQQKMISIQGEILHLKSDFARSEGTWVESFCQLEQIHARRIAEWSSEKASLQDQMKDLEDKLQGEGELFDGLLESDNVFEFRPSSDNRAKLCRALSLDSRKEQSLLSSPQRSPAWWSSPFRSPTRSHGLIQSLLDMGEASLDSADEEEMQPWQYKLAQVEMREKASIEELTQKSRQLAELQDAFDRIKTELTEEKEKAKEEAEDLAQEMAELRFQLMEMLDHERELRSRTEQASVHRVEELEAQLKRSRQETVAALARRRESEVRLDEKLAEIASIQLKLKKEALSVNQLRIENQDLQQQCKAKGLELAGLIEQQNTIMQAHTRAVGVETNPSEYGAADHTTVSHVGQLSLSEDLDAEFEADDGLTLTPKAEFEDAGVRMFEEWVKSGCLSMVPENGEEPEVVEYDMCQQNGKSDKELSPDNQFWGVDSDEPGTERDLSQASETTHAFLLEAGCLVEELKQEDQHTVDSAAVVSQEDIIVDQEFSEAVRIPHGDLGSTALADASAHGYELELETNGPDIVFPVHPEITSSEHFTATGEMATLATLDGKHACSGEDSQVELGTVDRQDDVQLLSEAVNEEYASTHEVELGSNDLKILPLVEEHGEEYVESGEDSQTELGTIDGQDNVQQLSEAVNEEYASNCEVELESSNLESLPLVEAEIDTTNTSQDSTMVAQVETMVLHDGLGSSADDFPLQLVLGDTEDKADQLSDIDAEVDDVSEDVAISLDLTARSLEVSEPQESDLVIPCSTSTSLEGDAENLCLNAHLDQLDGTPEVGYTGSQEVGTKDTITIDLQAEGLNGRIMAKEMQDLDAASKDLLDDAKQDGRVDLTQPENQGYVGELDTVPLTQTVPVGLEA